METVAKPTMPLNTTRGKVNTLAAAALHTMSLTAHTSQRRVN